MSDPDETSSYGTGSLLIVSFLSLVVSSSISSSLVKAISSSSSSSSSSCRCCCCDVCTRSDFRRRFSLASSGESSSSSELSKTITESSSLFSLSLMMMILEDFVFSNNIDFVFVFLNISKTLPSFFLPRVVVVVVVVVNALPPSPPRFLFDDPTPAVPPNPLRRSHRLNLSLVRSPAPHYLHLLPLNRFHLQRPTHLNEFVSKKVFHSTS